MYLIACLILRATEHTHRLLATLCATLRMLTRINQPNEALTVVAVTAVEVSCYSLLTFLYSTF